MELYDEINQLIKYLLQSTRLREYSSIIFDYQSAKASTEHLDAAIAELRRLNIIQIEYRNGNANYIMIAPVRKELNQLSETEKEKPYEYLLKKERDRSNKELLKINLEIESLNNTLSDYPQTRVRAKNSYIISIITVIGFVLTTLLQWTCNKHDSHDSSSYRNHSSKVSTASLDNLKQKPLDKHERPLDQFNGAFVFLLVQ